MLCSSTFQVGDIVRVRAARRRDVSYVVAEIGPVIVAVNDRGGECRYTADAFELVRPRTPSEEPTPKERVRLSASRTEYEAFADGCVVRPYPSEDIESLLRRFKKSVQKAGVVHSLRLHDHFVKRGDRRRQKAIRARRRRAAA